MFLLSLDTWLLFIRFAVVSVLKERAYTTFRPSDDVDLEEGGRALNGFWCDTTE